MKIFTAKKENSTLIIGTLGLKRGDNWLSTSVIN